MLYEVITVHVAKVERISEFMSAIKGDLANIDPEQYYKLRADLSKVEGDAYRKAFEQATYHQQQIDTFKKTPEDYDAELFSMGMLNYSGSDVNQKYDMLHPSLKKMKETIVITSYSIHYTKLYDHLLLVI